MEEKKARFEQEYGLSEYDAGLLVGSRSQSDFYEKLVSEYDHVPGYGTDDGSTVKLAAGWLIEKAGCKGLRMGNAGTYEKQSLILVNYGGASPDELIGVACFVRNKVADKFGIVLEPEVRIIGKKGECHL